jgi:hypothetical protein
MSPLKVAEEAYAKAEKRFIEAISSSPKPAPLSLRDYFAVQALQSGIFEHDDLHDYAREDMAELCYRMADAMLKAREATP